MGRDRQAAFDGGFHGGWSHRFFHTLFLNALFGFRRLIFIDSEAFRILIADFDITEHRTDRITLTGFGKDLAEGAGTWGSHPHDRFVGLHLNEVGICVNRIAFFEKNPDNGGLGNGFAELRHENGCKCHGILNI